METVKVENSQTDKINEFKKLLHSGIVEFKYTKKNGEVRDARGTLSIDVMGKENEPKGGGKEYPENVVRYYDLNSEGWRSFVFENLIEYKKT